MVQRQQGGVDVAAVDVGQLGTNAGEADPTAGSGCEVDVCGPDAVLDRQRALHTVRVPKNVGETQVGAVQEATQRAKHGVERLGRTGRSRRRARGEDLTAQAPTLVVSSWTKRPLSRYDSIRPRSLSLSRLGLSSFGPRLTRSGFGRGRDSAINTRRTARSVPVRSAGMTPTKPNLSTSMVAGRREAADALTSDACAPR